MFSRNLNIRRVADDMADNDLLYFTLLVSSSRCFKLAFVRAVAHRIANCGPLLEIVVASAVRITNPRSQLTAVSNCTSSKRTLTEFRMHASYSSPHQLVSQQELESGVGSERKRKETMTKANDSSICARLDSTVGDTKPKSHIGCTTSYIQE